MDMYTVFALTMVVIGFGALALGWLNLRYARTEIQAHRDFLKLWFDRVVEEWDTAKLTQGKIHTALADRIRSLEVYRAHHTERLNEQQDLIDLLNQDAERSSFAELSAEARTRIDRQHFVELANQTRPRFEDLNADRELFA